MTTLTRIECADCNMVFGMTEQFEKARRKDHASFYCPRGHKQFFPGQSDEEKLRDELARAKQRIAQEADFAREARERAEAANRRAAAAKGQVTKIKRRVSGGVCACCNRTFPNLAAHMKTKHPGFATESTEA